MSLRWSAVLLALMIGTADDVPKQKAAKKKADVFELKFGEQLRQLYRSELHFLRAITQPAKQQYERLLAENPAEPAMVKKMAAIISDRRLQRGRDIDGSPRAVDIEDLRKVVTDQLAKSLRPTLSAEQAERYRLELEERAKARKQTALLSLLARLDKVLLLSAEQRTQVGEVLKKNWDDSWAHTQWFRFEGRQFPLLPSDKLLPILTANQRVVWQGVPQGNIHWGINLGALRGIDIEDEEWPDEPPKAK